MFAAVPPGCTLALALLSICLLLVITFEISKGFYDTAMRLLPWSTRTRCPRLRR
jgi:hypothetical protein